VVRVWFGLVALLYLFLGLPAVATAIADELGPVRTTAGGALAPLDTLIVFDGDNRRGRVRESLRVFTEARPRTVSVLGADWLVRALVGAGIPADRIAHDNTTENTRDQIDSIRRLMATTPGLRVAIVASRLQMPRVAGLVDTARLSVSLVASPIDTEPPTTGFWQFVPMYKALRVSRDALYEHAALAYYRRQGWIK
jgi:hypothetical protein